MECFFDPNNLTNINIQHCYSQNLAPNLYRIKIPYFDSLLDKKRVIELFICIGINSSKVEKYRTNLKKNSSKLVWIVWNLYEMASVQYTSILDSLSDGIKRFKIMERMNFYFALIALVIIITDLIFYKITKNKKI